MAAAEGGGSDVDWSGDEGDQDWTHFGLKEDPNKKRKIGPADMENLTLETTAPSLRATAVI